MSAIKAIECIVIGTVQKVGYRDFVAKIGQKLELDGTVENLNDGTVKIQCKGTNDKIATFIGAIKVHNPDEAPLIDVENIIEKDIEATEIKENGFREKIGDPAKEIAQGLSTGMNYINLFRKDTSDNFKILDVKYGAISTAMAEVIKNTTERDQLFENKFVSIEKSVEKSNKNIENLLQILSKQKKDTS